MDQGQTVRVQGRVLGGEGGQAVTEVTHVAAEIEGGDGSDSGSGGGGGSGGGSGGGRG